MFKDRTEAGKKLAAKLSKYKNRRDTVVLAIPRGGVVVGRVIADALGVPLDVVVTRKLGMPGHEELAIGAVDRDGQVIMRDQSMVDDEALQDLVAQEREEIHRRELVFRGKEVYSLEKKMVILVDDGVATGSTAAAAIVWIRRQHPARLIVAIPGGAPETIARLGDDVDEIVVLETPEYFFAVGQLYEDFPQVSDEEVKRLLMRD